LFGRKTEQFKDAKEENNAGGGENLRPLNLKELMKSKRTKRTKAVKRQSKLLIKLGSWSSFIDEAYQLESLLARKPRHLQIEFVGSGEIPADTALLMRSMILKRSPQTRIITNARSSLLGPTVLIWLLGDTRLIREDAQLRIRPAGPFVPDHAPVAWKDRCACDECEIEEQDYVRVLQAINEFLPVKDLAGQPIEIPVLKQFGLVDNEKVDNFLAVAFRGDKERREQRVSHPKELAKETAR
jgi:hypothetical protein